MFPFYWALENKLDKRNKLWYDVISTRHCQKVEAL